MIHQHIEWLPGNRVSWPMFFICSTWAPQMACGANTEQLLSSADDQGAALMVQGTELPASLTLGPASLEASMQGAGMTPEIQALWKVPAAQATGSALFKLDSTQVTCKAPALDLSAIMHVRPAPMEDIKKATTQVGLAQRTVQVSLIQKGAGMHVWLAPLN